jgi:hypothetical protein
LTCEPVLAETAFHLADADLVFEVISEELIQLAFACNDHLAHLIALAKRYKGSQTGPGRSLPDSDERIASKTHRHHGG